MIKLVSVLKRRPGSEVATFQDYWRGTHAQVVARLPGLRRYIQSHTLPSGYGKHEPAADGIAELWFDDTNALRALENGPELAAVKDDEANFIDRGAHRQLFIDEHVIKDGPIPADGVKNIEFVLRKAGMSVAEFQTYWREVHGPMGASIATVCRYVQNHARSSSYRDNRQPPFDGLAITWFTDTDAMRASAQSAAYSVTRADEEHFLREPLDFIITREHVIVS